MPQEDLSGLIKELENIEKTMESNLENGDLDKIMSMDIQGLLKHMDQTNGALDIFESRTDALLEKVDALFQQVINDQELLPNQQAEEKKKEQEIKEGKRKKQEPTLPQKVKSVLSKREEGCHNPCGEHNTASSMNNSLSEKLSHHELHKISETTASQKKNQKSN